MIMLLKQVSIYRVERYKLVRATRKWAWVVVGHFLAMDKTDARRLGRNSLADKTCILRAVPVGEGDN